MKRLLLTGCFLCSVAQYHSYGGNTTSYQPTKKCHRDAEGNSPTKQIVDACDFQASAATVNIDDGTLFNAGRGVNTGVLITKCLRAKGYGVWEDAPGKYCPAHAEWLGWGSVDYPYDARLGVNIKP